MCELDRSRREGMSLDSRQQRNRYVERESLNHGPLQPFVGATAKDGLCSENKIACHGDRLEASCSLSQLEIELRGIRHGTSFAPVGHAFSAELSTLIASRGTFRLMFKFSIARRASAV